MPDEIGCSNVQLVPWTAESWRPLFIYLENFLYSQSFPIMAMSRGLHTVQESKGFCLLGHTVRLVDKTIPRGRVKVW